MHTFETPGPTTIVVRTGAGHVTVAAGDTDTTTVELTALNSAGEEAIAQATVEQSRHTVVVHLPKHRSGLLRQGPSVGIDIVCPHGVALDLKSDSADLRATGQFQEASCSTGSGDIDVETVTGAARLRTGSGTITAGEVGQALSVSSGSGDINVEASRGTGSVKVGSGDISIGELDGQTVTKTGSGDVEVGRLGGSLVTKTGSGSLTVRRASTGSVNAAGASGDITIGVEQGTAAWLDVSTVSGRVSQELGESAGPTDGQNRIEITAHTVSGNLRIHRA
jgi:DUF4097 and DUF4098 domain-containing protein YvlB